LVSATAELVLISIETHHSQEEIGMKLGINQAAVSKRQKRAQFHLVMEMERYFRNKIKTINT
jgi:predicted transcriptional regulator